MCKNCKGKHASRLPVCYARISARKQIRNITEQMHVYLRKRQPDCGQLDCWKANSSVYASFLRTAITAVNADHSSWFAHTVSPSPSLSSPFSHHDKWYGSYLSSAKATCMLHQGTVHSVWAFMQHARVYHLSATSAHSHRIFHCRSIPFVLIPDLVLSAEPPTKRLESSSQVQLPDENQGDGAKPNAKDKF